MHTLTDRQQQVLEFIRHTLHRNGIAPTLREIAAHFRFRSVKAAADHVEVLRRKGWVTAQPRRARTLQLTGLSPVARLPLYGSIPAGLPDDRYQDPRGGVTLDFAALGIRPTARTFVLEVRGDSMIGRHILPGDLVVLEHGKTPRSGDVVAALIDNESTLKTFVQERGAPPYLRAENPRYPQLHPAAELMIQGVMVGLVRRCKN